MILAYAFMRVNEKGIKCNLRRTYTAKRGWQWSGQENIYFWDSATAKPIDLGQLEAVGGKSGRPIEQFHVALQKELNFPSTALFTWTLWNTPPLFMLSLHKYSRSKNPANYSTFIFYGCKKARTTGLKLTCWPPLAAAPRRVSTACSLLLRSSRCASTFSFSLRTKSNSLFLSSSDDSSVFSCQ